MKEMTEIISGFLDQSISDEEAIELGEWIKADPANARVFVQMAYLDSHVHDLLLGEHHLRLGEVGPQSGGTPKRAAEQGDKDGGVQPSAGAQDEGVTYRTSLRAGGARTRLVIWRAAAAVIVVATLAIFFAWARKKQAVFTTIAVCSVYDARWTGRAPVMGERLEPGAELSLDSGLAELTLEGGGRAVIEGPAAVTVLSSRSVCLRQGKVAATVKGGGFVVRTSTALVTDMGTEFGVTATADDTSVEVFKGVVKTETLLDLGSSQQTLTLLEGQAARISPGAISPISMGALPQHYVRSLTQEIRTLDLVDLAAGGDGTTGRRGIGIDPSNGLMGSLSQIGPTKSDHRYHRVDLSSVVDGVFIPDEKAGAGPIDSAGDQHLFHTSWSGGYLCIWAGGSIPAPPFDPSGYMPTPMSSVLDGVDYSSTGHGLLAMHANSGMTFDLEAIRRLHPAHSLKQFRSLVGNTSVPALRRTLTKSDVWVLVDGEVRFRREGLTRADGAIRVDVPLQQSDRFLTLVTTDGGDSLELDHIIWADPELDVAKSHQ